MLNNAVICTREDIKTFEDNGIVFASLSFIRPVISGVKRSVANRFTHYYDHKFKRLCEHIEANLLNKLKAKYSDSLSASRPYTPMEITTVCNIYRENGCISVTTDIYENISHRRRAVLRQSDVWNEYNGWLIKYPCILNAGQNNIKKELIKKAEKQNTRFSTYLFADYKKLIKKNFSPDNFFLSDSKLYFYFNPGVIADKDNGTINFGLEYT